MREAVIVSAVRTAVGKAPKGTLRATRPDDLGASPSRARSSAPGPRQAGSGGCDYRLRHAGGEQGMNVARIASLRAGMPIESAAMTINRFCASGLQSIALAAERIAAGART
jgi:acetyl-CoA acyltransferase